VWLSDFWNLKKNMVCVNETLNGQTLNLTLNYQNFSPYWFTLQKTLIWKFEAIAEQGLEMLDMDEFKRMWIETDPILLTITGIVTILHSIFEMLAVKNDI